MILPNFPKNCMKLKEFGPPGGRIPHAPPLDLPLISTSKYKFCLYKKSWHRLLFHKLDFSETYSFVSEDTVE